MIAEVIREAWASNPRLVILSVPAAIVAVVAAWVLLVVAIVAGTPA